jgi:sporulation protein YlmC with PRC-barrel domain
MRSTMTTTTLEPLSRTGVGLADPLDDLRGRKVVDRNDQEVGKVHEVFIDPSERQARFLSIKSGDVLGFGGKTFLVPVDAIASANDDRVVIAESRDRILAGPQVDDEFGIDTTTDADVTPSIVTVYEWYGIREPFWSPTYQRPRWR